MPPKKKSTKVDVIPSTMTALRAQLEQRYGDSRIVRRENVKPYQVISTGSISVDYATVVGGIVLGRTHEIVGIEGVGKTTLAINAAAQAQKTTGKAVGYIDMEQTFDYDWAEANGLDTSNDAWLHAYPDDSEDVSDQLRMLCRTDLLSLIIVDSIGGMESRQALGKEADEHSVGRNAQVITRMVKNVAVLARKHQVAILFINQYRANISNPMGADISAGPKALKYNTTMKLEMRRSGEPPVYLDVNGDKMPVGVQVSCKVTRNKVAPAGKSGTFWIFNQPTEEYGPVGIDVADDALSLGIKTGVVEQGAGGYYTLPDGRRIRGRDSVMDTLRGEPDTVQAVREKALARISGDVVPETEVTHDEAAEDDQ